MQEENREIASLRSQLKATKEALEIMLNRSREVTEQLVEATTFSVVPSELIKDVVSVHDGGNNITLHFAEIKSAKTFRDIFPAGMVSSSQISQIEGDSL